MNIGNFRDFIKFLCDCDISLYHFIKSTCMLAASLSPLKLARKIYFQTRNNELMYDYSGETQITVILKCINGSNKNLY